MQRNRRRWVILIACLAVLGTASPSSTAYADGKDLALVVGLKSSVSGLSYHELKQLYMGNRLKTPAGEWMVPLNRKNGTPERVGFDDSVLGMSPDVAKKYWIDRKIRGQSGPPKAISSSALIMRLVNKVPGAIGYVRASEVTGVKVVKIDGKRPGEAGYAVRF